MFAKYSENNRDFSIAAAVGATADVDSYRNYGALRAKASERPVIQNSELIRPNREFNPSEQGNNSPLQ
jgi:hypothetical protein